MSTVPTDLVQPVSAVARATSPQAGAQSSGDASPFEAFLGAGSTPPSQTLSRPSPSSRAGATGQNTTPTTAANHQQTPGATPGPRQPPAPSHGSTGGSSARSRLTPGPNPQPGTAADGTGSTATKLPIPTLTDPAGANASTTGEPMIAGSDSAALDDPILATPVHKSDKASSGKGDEASTTSLAAPPRDGSVASQGTVPTIIAAAAASPPAPAAAAPTLQTGVAGTAVVSVTAPPPGAAFAASAPTPTQLVPVPSSLPLDPTTAGGLQAADMGNAPADPTAPESPSEKAGDSTPASADIALAKPTQTSASTTPMASSEAVGGSAESATPQAHVASAATPAAANHAAVAAAADPHFDPVDSAGAPRPDDATGPARPDLAQSFTPPVSANSPAPATAAPLTAAPATSSPLSPQTVPISGLAIEIAARATRDEKSFQIRLDPPELGRIDVQLNVDASGHVTTHLTVDRPETLNLLRQDASSLQRALESTGLKANSGGLEFSLRNHSSGGQGGGQRGGQSNGTTPSVARIVVSDADMPAGQTATRGYARLLGVGTGVDIRV